MRHGNSTHHRRSPRIRRQRADGRGVKGHRSARHLDAATTTAGTGRAIGDTCFVSNVSRVGGIAQPAGLKRDLKLEQRHHHGIGAGKLGCRGSGGGHRRFERDPQRDREHPRMSGLPTVCAELTVLRDDIGKPSGALILAGPRRSRCTIFWKGPPVLREDNPDAERRRAYLTQKALEGC